MSQCVSRLKQNKEKYSDYSPLYRISRLTMPSFEEEFKEATHPGPGRKIPGAVLIAADRSGG